MTSLGWRVPSWSSRKTNTGPPIQSSHEREKGKEGKSRKRKKWNEILTRGLLLVWLVMFFPLFSVKLPLLLVLLSGICGGGNKTRRLSHRFGLLSFRFAKARNPSRQIVFRSSLDRHLPAFLPVSLFFFFRFFWFCLVWVDQSFSPSLSLPLSLTIAIFRGSLSSNRSARISTEQSGTAKFCNVQTHKQ